MRILLVHNPGAGAQDQPDEDDLLRMIHDAGHDAKLHPYDDMFGDDTAAIAASHDIIAIAGGDGTTGRLIKHLHGCTVPLAFLPMGTANNIARSFGLADLTLAQQVAGWHTTRPRSIDLGHIEAPWGQAHFIEAVGEGLFTRTMLEIEAFNQLDHLSTPQDKIAEALKILRDSLRTFPVRRMNLRLDGEDLSGDYLMLEAMNIRFVGPNLYVAPGCDPCDGLLDVVLIGEPQRSSLIAHLERWRAGTLLAPELPTFRGAHLEIEWQGATLHVDDEAWPPAGEGEYTVPSRIDVRTRKAAVQVIVPGR